MDVPELDDEWFEPDVWPVQVPGPRAAAESSMDRMRGLSDEVWRTST